MRASRIDKKTGKPHISEKVFTAQVITMARAFGWMAAHFRPALTQRGRWITAMAGDIGYPDITMARNKRVIFAELKTEIGNLTFGQSAWQSALPNFYVWRPSDIEEIERILR